VLGLPTLLVRVDKVSLVEAKLHMSALSVRSGIIKLEEGWLVWSLYHKDGVGFPEIGHLMGRHRSWVWRRLMVVEALDVAVQANVCLGLVAPRAAVAVSWLPRGNQMAASAVVIWRGLTVRQTELMVKQALAEPDAAARAAVLVRKLNNKALTNPPGPQTMRALCNEADWMSGRAVRTAIGALVSNPAQDVSTGGGGAYLRACLGVRLRTHSASAATPSGCC
jgi:hypothetical protein